MLYADFTCKVGGSPLLREIVLNDGRVKELERELFPDYAYNRDPVIHRSRGDADGVDELYIGLEEIYDEDVFNHQLEQLYKEATAAGAPCHISGIYEVDCERWAFDIRPDGKIHEFHLTWLQDLPTEELEAIKEFHEQWRKEHPNELAQS